MNPYHSALGWMTIVGLILGPLAIVGAIAVAQSMTGQGMQVLVILLPIFGYILCGMGSISLFAWLIVGAIISGAPSRRSTHTGQIPRVG